MGSIMAQPRQLAVYRTCTPVVDAKFNTDSDQSPAEAVITALSEAMNIDPVELPPLYEFIEPEALDRLFTHQNTTSNADAVLSFTIETWNVFVRHDGQIRVCDATKPTNPGPIFDSINA